jgi:rhamnose utilization protein RhaD (predicted bifunctional aldolase and dehydrogenase)
MNDLQITHSTISKLCASFGKDPLLVQGAGGNVSWKNDGELWIKGSGTWLAHADKEDLFVPVYLTDLQEALAQGNFDIKPQVIGEHLLRPSIETILHAVMPQTIVVHLHAVDALSHLVTKDCEEFLDGLFKQSDINSIFVDYHKPGPELARAIDQALKSQSSANVVLLKNHGIVIGADSIEEIQTLLRAINTVCEPRKIPDEARPLASSSRVNGYIPFTDPQVQELALNPNLYKRLQFDWVLFPDHAVFLGPKAFTYHSWEDYLARGTDHSPELIFVENIGVFTKPDFGMAKGAQLRCYYDVISRVMPNETLDPLDDAAVHALLNWDAEKLRQQMSK